MTKKKPLAYSHSAVPPVSEAIARLRTLREERKRLDAEMAEATAVIVAGGGGVAYGLRAAIRRTAGGPYRGFRKPGVRVALLPYAPD